MTNHLYLPVIVLLIGGAGFAIGPIVLAWIWAKKFSPRKPGPGKNAIYECGLESSFWSSTWKQSFFCRLL